MAASPKEFREFAQDCLRWADETQSERHRQVLLDIAKTWMQAALQLERSLALIDDSMPPPRPKPRPAKSAASVGSLCALFDRLGSESGVGLLHHRYRH